MTSAESFEAAERPNGRLAILGCPSPQNLISVMQTWKGRVDLLATGRTGDFSAARGRVMKRLRKQVIGQGILPRRLRVVTSESTLGRLDAVANINGYGAVWKADALPCLLKKISPKETLVLMEGGASAALAALRAAGSVEAVSCALPEMGAGETMTALRYHPDPAQGEWPEMARALAGEHGFYHAQGEHSLLFIPRSDVLVVTFDNLDLALEKRRDQRPWGFDFIAKQGWSMLGVMASGWTWYRDDWLFAQFDNLVRDGFFARFRRVVFYGASMGGYGACTFARAVPGADVVAISPQSSLDPALVPWEQRYRKGAERDFRGAYGDGAAGIATAARVFVFYDPYQAADARHAERLQGEQVVKLRAPLLGHRLGSSLGQMGILSPLILAALEGRLCEGDFYRALRCRHAFPRYQRELFQCALRRGRPDLARRVAAWVLARGRHRFIRRAVERLDAVSGNLALPEALAGQ